MYYFTYHDYFGQQCVTILFKQCNINEEMVMTAVREQGLDHGPPFLI